MRFLSTFCTILLSLTTFILFSCSNKTEDFTSEPISDYIPLQTGKYITYRLDSLVFTNFGRNLETHRYQVKNVIDVQMTDNQGRPTYRVYSYIRDSAGTQSWNPNGTYYITPLANQIEVSDDNFRIIKMHLPIKSGFTWKGNAYLPTDPYESLNPYNSYDFGMSDWEFIYDGETEPAASLQGRTYNDVLTVEQRDEHFNAPVTDIHLYGSKDRSVEKYSKNIGLVYRKHVLWDYQTSLTPHYTGFGITMWMIDHN